MLFLRVKRYPQRNVSDSVLFIFSLSFQTWHFGLHFLSIVLLKFAWHVRLNDGHTV